MSKFKVGEIAIGQNFVNTPKRNGMECEILSILEWVECENITTGERTKGWRHMVGWADGKTTYQETTFLKKKPPEEKASWEEIHSITNWHPQKVTV